MKLFKIIEIFLDTMAEYVSINLHNEILHLTNGSSTHHIRLTYTHVNGLNLRAITSQVNGS